MVLHFFFLALYWVLSNSVNPETLDFLLLVHCTIGVFMNVSKRRTNYLYYGIYAGIILATLANLLVTVDIAAHGVKEFSVYRYIVPAYIPEATVIWCIGNAATLAGYELSYYRSLPKIDFEINKKSVLRNIYYFAAGYIFLTINGTTVNFSLLSGGVGKVITLLCFMSILVFARIWGEKEDKAYKNYAIILTLLQTTQALTTSFLRADLLTPAFCLFVGYFIGKGKLNYLWSYRVVPAVSVLLIFAMFFPALGANRAHFIGAFTGRAPVENASYHYVGGDGMAGNGALERSSNVAQLSNIVKLTKKNGFYGGRASLPLIAALVPRFIWPDKPIIQLGAWFAVEIGAGYVGESGRSNNSVNMTIPGELYLDFGYAGLIIGSFLLGMLYCVLWNSANFSSSASNLTGTLWGGYLLLNAIVGMGADLQVIISFLSTYITFLIIKKIFSRNANTMRRPALAGK